MSFLQRTGELKFAAALVAVLAISACAKAPADSLAGLNGGRATPGSPRDFAVNVGESYWRFYQYQDAMQQEARFE